MSERLNALMAEKFVEGKPSGTNSPVEQLSDRELEVFRNIGHGVKSREIADRLHVSVKTIDSHRERIKKKLELNDGTDLLRRAVLWVSEDS